MALLEGAFLTSIVGWSVGGFLVRAVKGDFSTKRWKCPYGTPVDKCKCRKNPYKRHAR